MDERAEERRREALIEAGLTLASELSLPAALQKITELACRVADARYGALGVLSRDGTTLEDFITYGVTEAEREAIGHLPEGHGILGVLITEAHPLRLHSIQDDPRSHGFPPNHPRMTTFLGVPVKVRNRVFGNLYLTEKRGGGDFTPEDEEAVKTLASQAGITIENARLYREAKLGRDRLQAVNEVTAEILSGSSAEDVLHLVAARARELVGAALASIVTPTDDGERLVVRAAEGAMADRLQDATLEARGSISEQVMRTGSPLMIPSLADDPRVQQPAVGVGGVGPGLFVPLGISTSPFGTLMVANLEGGPGFADEDLEVVRLFARQAAVAVEYARARAELQRLAVLEDRERIAQELHDGVIQALFAVGMGLQATSAKTGDAGLQERLAGAVTEIDGVIRDLRNYIFALHTGSEADRQLDLALRELAKGFDENDTVTVVAEVDPQTAAIFSGHAAEILQMAREALSNAVRHAAATTVRLSLRREHGEVVLEVEDDGTGFDLEGAAGKGDGLANLRARAEALGGRLEIESAGEGTTVRIRVPT